MKKFLSLSMAVLMALSFTACSGKSSGNTTDAPAAGSETATQAEADGEVTSDEAGEETTEETPAAEPELLAPETNPIEFENGKKVKVENIALDQIVEVPGEAAADMYGGKLYVGNGEDKIDVITIDGGSAKLESQLDIKNRNNLSIDKDGKIYVEGGVFAAKIYNQDGSEAGEAVDSGEITVSKTSDFALSYFPGADAVTKMEGGASSPWIISGLKEGTNIQGPFKNVSKVLIQGDHVLVGGHDKENEDQLLYVYDYNGTEIAKTTEDAFGNGVYGMAEVPAGYMVLTGSNVLAVYNTDGSFMGDSNKQGSKKTFGLNGMDNVLCGVGLFAQDDGSVIAVFTAKDASGTEQLVLYRLTIE